jgi:hypothetical protein
MLRGALSPRKFVRGQAHDGIRMTAVSGIDSRRVGVSHNDTTPV